jgi:hypothetical protein
MGGSFGAWAVEHGLVIRQLGTLQPGDRAALRTAIAETIG